MEKEKTQEFVIKGTIDGVMNVLMKDFGMSYNEAKYFSYIMINRHPEHAVNTIDEEELNVWYLSDKEEYAGKIFSTHLYINFTSVQKEVYRMAYMFLVNFIFSRNIDLVLIGTELMYTIAAAISKIEDTDYCVFSRIVELCVGDKKRLFSIDDIRTGNKDGKCDYQEKSWNCTYLGQHENCTCNKEKIELSFENLEKKHIIKRIGDRWMLER